MTKTYTDAPCPILNQKGRNVGYIWNFYGRIDCPTKVDFGTDTDELAYFRVISAATSGDLEGVRARVESEAETGTTMNINAFHGDAVVNADGYAAIARGIYTDAMVKDDATVTSVRGGDFNVSIYDGATITNCEGLRVVVGHPTAAVSISGVDTLLHLILDGSNLHTAKSAIDIDCDTGTTVTVGIDFGSDNVVTAIDVGGCSVFADADVTLATADNAMELIVTDSGALATGTIRSLYIQHTNTGAKTATAKVEGISLVMNQATADIADIMGMHIHIDNHSANYFTGNMVGLMVDFDDPGTNATSVMLLDLYRDNTHTGAARDCYVRCKSGGTVDGKTIFLLESTSGKLADQLFTVCGSPSPDFMELTTLSGGIAARLKVLLEATPSGGTYTQYYIPLYTS